MSAVESSPPSAPNTTHPTKPATPTLVSVAGWVLLAIAVGWLVLIGYTGVTYATTQLSHFSTWRAQSLVEAQAYYPVMFLLVSAFGNVTLHGFCTVAYLRGYRWAALVLSVALALGVLASLLIMLAVAALLGTLNGAPSRMLSCCSVALRRCTRRCILLHRTCWCAWWRWRWCGRVSRVRTWRRAVIGACAAARTT